MGTSLQKIFFLLFALVTNLLFFSKTWKLVFQKTEVTDISDDFNFVRSLFDLMVEGELCPEHLENVVEDFLSDGCPKIISFPKKSDDPLPVA